MKNVININIKEFLEKFEANYDFLYNANTYVAGYDEAVIYGDEFIRKHPEFVGEFCRYRGDILSSDREIAAFAFTLSDMSTI